MSLFTHEARQFKFDVLREVARRTFEGRLSESTPDELAMLLIPTSQASFIRKGKSFVKEPEWQLAKHRL